MQPNPRWPAFLLLFACLLTPLAAAGPYLSSNELPDASKLLPPPPAPGSPEDIADRESAYHVYAAHTPEQFANASDQQQLTPFHLTAKVVPWFQPGKFPKTEALLKQVQTESYAVSQQAKRLWNRPRPYVAEPNRFNPVIDKETKPTPSYPSGHAIRATLFASILAELFPEHREAIYEKAAESGWLRVMGGVHTPLDIFAGRTLGQATAQAFLKSEAFQKDLLEAKAELAAHAQKAGG
ncbi:MAG: phosphatase PAP2 family protein [Nibricoccus sp.]